MLTEIVLKQRKEHAWVYEELKARDTKIWHCNLWENQSMSAQGLRFQALEKYLKLICIYQKKLLLYMLKNEIINKEHINKL